MTARTLPVPRNGTKHSPNLARWLNKNQRSGRRADVFLDREGCRWIGWIEDDTWFIGTRLMRTLIDGTKANVGCWTFPVSDLLIDDGFWDRYERIGRCAVDEAHTQLFVGDDSRWRQDGATRECTWCGAFAQRERVWSETVEHRAWDPIAHLNTIAQGGSSVTKQWTWWTGHQASVDDDGTYDIGNRETREAAIQDALRDTCPGDRFYVIEAVMAPWEDDGDPDNRVPFQETRNRELLTNGPVA